MHLERLFIMTNIILSNTFNAVGCSILNLVFSIISQAFLGSTTESDTGINTIKVFIILFWLVKQSVCKGK